MLEANQTDFVLQVARKGTGFLTANDLQAMVSDEEEEDQPLYSPVYSRPSGFHSMGMGYWSAIVERPGVE